MLKIFDYQCETCNEIFELIIESNEKGSDEICPKCNSSNVKQLPASPIFKLIFNQKRDMADWNGNTNHFYDQYKKDKENGKKVELPDKAL